MALSMEEKDSRWNGLYQKLEEHLQTGFLRWLEADFVGAQEYLEEDTRLIEGKEIEIKLDADALRHAIVLRGKITVEPG